MPKVLISDAMDDVSRKILISHKIEVDVITDLKTDKLKEIIQNYDGLIVRSATKVTEEIIENAKKLKIIGRAGAGVDNIDVKFAKSKNIIVMNTPGGNSNATAEHSLALLFSLIRLIPTANFSTHKGLWEKKKFKGNEIKGKTIGIIGFGFVGQRFAEMCFSLGLNVNICSNYFKSIKDQYTNYNYLNLNDIIPNSDIISFHCKPNIDNSSIINLNHMKNMKKNCLIINTSRGNLVNEKDLKTALEQGIIAGAAIDVFSSEPAKTNILFNAPNLILTPHIAASTAESQTTVAEMIANQFSEYFNSGKIINSI